MNEPMDTSEQVSRAREDFRDLRAAVARFAALLDGSPAELLARTLPEVSGWSVHQHLFHAALATELGLRNVAGLARGTTRLARPFRSIADWALEGLERGAIERGFAQAPRMVRPPERVDAELLREIVATNAADLERLEPLLDQLPAAQGCVPHQAMGDLTALQWLRFVSVHARHHLAIVDEIARAAG